jgi:hypothetical protein
VDHFNSPNMEIKKSGLPPQRYIGAPFELRFLQIQAEKFSVYCYLWCIYIVENNNVKYFLKNSFTLESKILNCCNFFLKWNGNVARIVFCLCG